MDYNSFKEDEQSVEKSKLQTLKRLFSYLLKYKEPSCWYFCLWDTV